MSAPFETHLFPYSLFLVLFQSMHLLTLASYLEERAAKLRREALGRVQVALAGSGSNSMYRVIDSYFGYQTEGDSEVSTPVEAPASDALLSQIASAVAGSSTGRTLRRIPSWRSHPDSSAERSGKDRHSGLSYEWIRKRSS